MKKLAFGVVVLSVVAYVALRRGGNDVQQETTVDQKVVLDRIWIDHIPKNDRDIINVFVAITEQPFGIFDAGSQWTAKFELFQYEENGGEIRVYYGQTGEREKIKARATKCNHQGFELCLQLEGNSRGVGKYYSMEDWVIDSRDQLDHIRQQIATKLSIPSAE